MPHRKAWLTKRVKLDGVWRTAAPVLTQAGVPTEKVLVEGAKRVAPGTFVVEYYDRQGRRCRKTAGTNAIIAFKQLKHLQRKLEDQADGHEVRFESASSRKHPFKVAVDAYVSELRDIRGLTEKSIRGIEQLLAVFEVAYLEDLTKEDVIRGLIAKLAAKEYSKQTIFDRFAKVVSFLKWCRDPERGWSAPVVRLKDGPPRPRRKGNSDGGRKQPYSAADMNALFKVSTAQEKLWWLFLLHTGCREGEMTHATWGDLDLRTREFHVTFKEGFTPKDREERTVPFGQELCDALKAHKQASGNPPDDALLFPHNGKVHRHIIRNLKQCARVAGLRGDWYLHRFLHTFAPRKYAVYRSRQSDESELLLPGRVPS